MMGMLQAMMERLDWLENQACSRPNPSGSRASNCNPPVICHRCGQEGNFARGCASSRRPNRPSSSKPIAAIPDSCSVTVAGTMHGITTAFLVDTGAAVSLLRKDVWDKLLLDPSSLTLWDGSPLVGRCGRKSIGSLGLCSDGHRDCR